MQSSAPDDGRKHRPKHVELTRNNKLTYIVANRWLLSQNYYIAQTEFPIQKTSFKQRVLYESTSAYLKLKTNFETKLDLTFAVTHIIPVSLSMNLYLLLLK